MKKVFYTLVCLFLFFNSFEAYSSEPLRFGIIGGVNHSNIRMRLDARVGLHAGVIMEYNLPRNFYLESGLVFTQKGYKHYSEEEGTYTIEGIQGLEILEGETLDTKTTIRAKARKNMLELPLHVGYKYTANKNLKIFASLGGYLGYGLSGKLKGRQRIIADIPENIKPMLEMFDISDVNETEINSKIYNNIDKRFDWGIGYKCGVELMDKILISASYHWGINNVYTGTSGGNNDNLMLSLAYLFF